MGPLRGTSADGREGSVGRTPRPAPFWAPIRWAPIRSALILCAPIWFAIACNAETVTPPRILVPAEDTLAPVPPCFGQYCNQTLLAIFDMHPFYRKILVTQLIPIVGSHEPSDAALDAAAQIVDSLLVYRDDVRDLLIEINAFVGIMSPDEVTTDIPEHRYLRNDPVTNWDQRARGLGGTRSLPITTAAEENLLCLAGDVYAGESILVHEFAHTIHLIAINVIDPGFDAELDSILNLARDEGKWSRTYADTNIQEYWAEGVQSWFDVNQDPQDLIHNDVDTRDELLEYDPRLHEMISRYFAATDWSPSCPSD